MKKIIPFLALLLTFSAINAQSTIAEIRAYADANIPTVDGNVADYDIEFTVSGIALNGSELGPIRYIRDATGSMAIYDGSSLADVQLGDEVTVTGNLIEFAGLLEISGIPEANVTIVSTGNPTPDPEIIPIAGMEEANEGKLVQLFGVTFQDPDVFAGNSNYTIEDGDGNTGQLRVSNGSPLVGTGIPVGPIDITGILGQFNATYQLLPRTIADFNLGGAPGFAAALAPNDFSATTVDFNIQTGGAGDLVFAYGTDPANLDQSFEMADFSNDHIFEITDLNPGEIYFYQVTTTSETGESSVSNVLSFGTVSESTGVIKAFFNNPVDVSVSTGTDATYTNNSLGDTIVHYINNATESIDIAAYNIGNTTGIITALNEAYANGIEVRMVLNADINQAVLDIIEIDPTNISTRPPANADSFGEMHNKFISIDANSDDPNAAYVMTGSTNFTNDQVRIDPNNLVLIQDQTLAKAYSLELSEMLGGTFGADKSIIDVPTEFKIGGDRVELYFSPNGNLDNIFDDAIASAETDLYFAIFSFTVRGVAYEIEDVNDSGVQVGGVMNNSCDVDNFDNDPAEILQEADLSVGLVGNESAKLLHHKYMVIDQGNPGSDPMVITGSANWSSNGFYNSDENVVIIHNASLANQFYQEWKARFDETAVCDQIEEPMDTMVVDTMVAIQQLAAGQIDFAVYPNPVRDHVFFSLDSQINDNVTVRLVDLRGQVLYTKDLEVNPGNKVYQLNLSAMNPGVYFIQANGVSQKIVLQ